ncbi:hypothetical protein [Amycolatopsis pigmentata]|uniref:Uncharacterized protein n=1 Tax=Amycolatopsis pigmentata TaxID=450801 RepID=A0ABW5FL08_9PSEU
MIHTDYIREMQRGFVTPEQVPALHKVSHNAWELHGSPTEENVVAGFVEHANAVARGVRIVIGKLGRDGFDAMVEGAHFHSGIIDDIRAENVDTDVQPTLLTVSTADELRKLINSKEAERAPGGDRKKWRESIPAMLTIQDFLISDAHAHGIRVAVADEWRSQWDSAKSHYSI